MIVNTKIGLLLSGTIGKAPELRRVGQNDKAVLKFSLRYGSEEDDTGKRRGKYIDVDVWTDAEELDGMLAEDDAVMVAAREIRSREYNGKTYYSVNADGVFPGAGTILRWMQQVLDMAAAAPAASPTGSAAALDGHALYPGEQLDDYTPSARTSCRPAAPEPLIEDAEDLPF